MLIHWRIARVYDYEGMKVGVFMLKSAMVWAGIWGHSERRLETTLVF